MKRYVGAGAAVVLLAIAGWTLVWWMGRGELAQGLDAGVERLVARGWTVTWGRREIGGFPFGYRIALGDVAARDTASGFEVRLPQVVAEREGGRILVRLPETFAADIPVPQPPGSEPAEQPELLPTTGESRNLVASFPLDGDGAVEVAGDRFVWRLDDPAAGGSATGTLAGFKLAMEPAASGLDLQLDAARVGLETAQAQGEGPPATVAAELLDAVATVSTTVGSTAALGEMLYAGAPGQADGSLRTGLARISVVSTGETPGKLDWRADAVELEAALESGRMELSSETRDSVFDLAPADPESPVRGTVSIGSAEALYAMPMAPSEKPDEMAIGLTLKQVRLGDDVWARIDPEAALPHAAASLAVDLAGTARVTERIDRLPAGAEPPFEISHLDVREVTAAALGAALTASGEIEILQPLGVPLGEVDVALTGVEGLLRALGRAGIVPPEMVTTGQAILAVYLRPAKGNDSWTTDIRFTHEGPLVNGMPVRR